MLSRVLIILGLFVTVIGNLVTAFGLHKAVNGMMTAATSGIADVAYGMDSAFRWVHVGLFGCFILVAGLVLAAVKPSARSGAV
jgi:hypothetical protein